MITGWRYRRTESPNDKLICICLNFGVLCCGVVGSGKTDGEVLDMNWLRKLFGIQPDPEPRIYRVEAFNIVVGSSKYIQEQWLLKTNGDNRDVAGFYDIATRTVYVDCNMHDKSKPNFEYLGHEVWHLEELGGLYYHK